MRLLSMMKRKLYDVLVTAITVMVMILISNKAAVQARTRYERFHLTASYGSFSSPNYPRPYPNNIYYEWILPITSQKLQLEFITFDIYRCYLRQPYRNCADFDFAFLLGNKAYCNWNRPPRAIIVQPWTKIAVSFYSSHTKEECKGQGFQAKYKPFVKYETTKKSTLATTTSYALTRSESDSSSSDSLSFLFLLPLLFISLVLVIVCLYWCCCRRPIATQQERMPTDAGNGHIHGTPIGEEPICNAMQNSYHNDVFLTVNLPQDQQPQQRAESNNATAQNGPPSTQTVLSHDERIGCSHESLNMPADEYPPPSYDDVWDENLDLENFDCPPSYEAVMRQSRERLDQGAESADLQRNRGTHETPGRLNLEANLEERGEIVI